MEERKSHKDKVWVNDDRLFVIFWSITLKEVLQTTAAWCGDVA